MSYNYSKSRQLALRVLKHYGASGSVIKKGNVAGFNNNGDAIQATDDTVISGTITPLVKYKSTEINNTSIEAGDSYVLFQSDSPVAVGMQTTLNNTTFRVVDVTFLTSISDVNIFVKLQLRV